MNTVCGCHIEFEQAPLQLKLTKEAIYDSKQKQMVRSELDKHLVKGVMQQVEHYGGEYISKIFTRPQKSMVAIELY